MNLITIFLLGQVSLTPEFMKINLLYGFEKLEPRAVSMEVVKDLKQMPDSEFITKSLSLLAQSIFDRYARSDTLPVIEVREKFSPIVDSLFNIYLSSFRPTWKIVQNYILIKAFFFPYDTMMLDSLFSSMMQLADTYPDIKLGIFVPAFALPYSPLWVRMELAKEEDLPLENLNPKLLQFIMFKSMKYGMFDLALHISYLLKAIKSGKIDDILNLYRLRAKCERIKAVLKKTKGEDWLKTDELKYLIECYKSKGEFEEALKILRKALNVRKVDTTGYIYQELGIINYEKGNYSQSLYWLNLAKAYQDLNRNLNVLTLYYLAKLYIKTGHYNKAIETIERGIKLYPEYRYDFLLLKHYLYYNSNEYEKATRLILSLNNLKNTTRRIDYYFYARGKDLLSIGDTIYACHEFRKMFTLLLALPSIDTATLRDRLKLLYTCKLKDPRSMFTAAYIYSRLGEFDSARHYYKILIKKDPNNPLYLNNMAYLLIEEGKDIEAAKPLIEKAYKLSPYDPYILDTYGWYYYKRGDIKKAYEFIKKAYLNSSDPVIKQHYEEIVRKLKLKK